MSTTRQLYTLWDDLKRLDLGDSGACPAKWQGRDALYLEKLNSAVFLRDEVSFRSFRLQAEVAIPHEVGFIGLVFGAKDPANYELIYLAPVEIQYDPIMNGSMTWQIYNGPSYQLPLPNMTGAWQTFTVEVQPEGAIAYLGDGTGPRLVLSSLQHGGTIGKLGIWSFLPSYIRNLSIEEIEPAPLERRTTDLQKLQSETYITAWQVSDPFLADQTDERNWAEAFVEENGTLNINRIHKAEPGVSVEVRSTVTVAEEQETTLSLGFSDGIRLWLNDKEIYQGEWFWKPPAHDGRIRPDLMNIPVKWHAGLNTIRAEIKQTESFGWGLAVKTGLHA
ncbi:hypothetical protein ACFFSY_01335 [Paenibacillus aurantiacus]|uniref:3-keto-disaccharide hydrolase domain-containing protein n=1 Tax=Paenibacillus aurantiacus TaxID=1936118 RepID=A0ABV5KH75_9BACL